MATPLSKPTTMLQPFARGGNKNTIPDQPDATPGHASMQLGFPPLTMTRIEDGGKPPSGLDFNGIFNFITQHSAWLNAGGQYTFNTALATYIGGYPVGMVLQSNDGLSSFVNVQANNSTDFNTTPAAIGVSWMPWGGSAVSPSSVTNVTTTGGNVVLTGSQAAARIIRVSGALTADANIVFPNSGSQSWIVVNATSGAFTVRCAPSGGTSVIVSQGVRDLIVSDGSTMTYGQVDTVTQATSDSSIKQASTAFVKNAIAAALVNTALTGTPTAPTPAANDNTTRIATMAALQTAVASATANSVPQYKNANFTASVTGDYWVDTTAGAVTMTLPDPPTNQNLIRVQDIAGTWGVRPLIINPGTKTILGVNEVLVDDLMGHSMELWYDGTTWRLV